MRRPILFSVLLLLLAFALVRALQLSVLDRRISNVSAVDASAGIGVYWDFECSSPVRSIDWGVLAPGSQKTITVFVRNEASAKCFLGMKIVSLNPTNVLAYLDLSWKFSERTVTVGKIVQATLILGAPFVFVPFSEFSFGIAFEGTDSIPGDVDMDGYVGMDDLWRIIINNGAEEGTPAYDQSCDIDRDGCVDLADLNYAVRNYGQEIL